MGVVPAVAILVVVVANINTVEIDVYLLLSCYLLLTL